MAVLEVRHLRLIAAIADTGSITGAARTLHLTQPALSRQLTELETRLGVALFARVNRRLVMSAAGERLLGGARRVLTDLERVERELTSGAFAADAGLVRLATECYTNYHWLPAVLVAFREQWPHVDVRIVPEATARPLAALLNGTLDVAVVHRTPAHQALRYAPLFDDEMVVVTHPGHRLAGQAFVAPGDFAAEQLFVYATHSGESSVLTHVLQPNGVEPRQTSRIQLTEAILELVRAGLGITVLSRWAVERHVAAHTLAAIRLTKDGYRRRWFAATRADVREAAYLRAFVGLLADSRFAPAEAPGAATTAAQATRTVGRRRAATARAR